MRGLQGCRSHPFFKTLLVCSDRWLAGCLVVWVFDCHALYIQDSTQSRVPALQVTACLDWHSAHFLPSPCSARVFSFTFFPHQDEVNPTKWLHSILRAKDHQDKQHRWKSFAHFIRIEWRHVEINYETVLELQFSFSHFSQWLVQLINYYFSIVYFHSFINSPASDQNRIYINNMHLHNILGTRSVFNLLCQ